MFLIISTLFFLNNSFADCANPLKVENKNYCLEISWQKADKLQNNSLTPSDNASPQLNKMGVKPKNWLYSKLNILVWEAQDDKKNPVILKNFNVFPFMTMSNGHHHSTSYGFYENLPVSSYTMDGMGFMEMQGCWSLRWSLTPGEELSSSTLIDNITAFANLNTAENSVIANYCQN